MKLGVMKNKVAGVGLLAIVLNFLVEVLSRRSFGAGAVHICTAPHIFIYNVIIILFTFTFCLLARKRKFTLSLICVLWVVAGVIDFVLLFFRKTPFTASDFALIVDAFKIGPVYLGYFGFGAVIVLLILLIAGFIICWKRAKKIDMSVKDYLKGALTIVLSWVIVYILTIYGMQIGMLSTHYSNIGLAYHNYGFAYCFGNSIFRQGIEKPTDYDKIEVKEIITDNNTNRFQKQEEPEYPNIIFLQLESFMNPNLIKDVTFNENPVEYFHELVINYPSGYLSVPAFGAGTANTEFEIMSGMNLEDFGPGEYPYKTVLKDNTCETTAYILKSLGYTTHAMHNNDGTFYSRNEVFRNLGFDTFTSLEYMGEHEITPVGWAKDDILVGQINKALDSSEGLDYIYAISVQGHGDYPDTLDGIDVSIYEEGFFDEEQKIQFVYYINQLNEMDDFIRDLTESLEKRDEKTVLVLYGDHLPGFSFTDDVLHNGDIYQTQYVVWSNYDIWLSKKNIQAYQLSSRVLNAIGIKNGVLNKYHHQSSEDEDYLENLTMLEYDMLYGNGEAYGEQGKYEPASMKMGIEDILIKDAYNYDGHICVEGKNFTPFSDVTVNGRVYTAECVNEHTLLVDDILLEQGDKITVVQRGEDKVELSETDVFVYTGGKEN